MAARLAMAGHEVWLVARGEHARAIEERGLRLIGHDGVHALGRDAIRLWRPGDPGAGAGAAPFDLLVFAVKAPDLEEAVDSARPLIGERTRVLPLQNGIDAAERIQARAPGARVLGGSARIVASIEEPGTVRAMLPLSIVLGELEGGLSDSARAVGEALSVPGLKVTVSAEGRAPLWAKFVFICGFSGMTSLCRTSIGPVLQHPESAAMLEQTMREVEAVGRAHGAPLQGEVAVEQLAFCRKLDPAATSSMLGDLQRGRRLELDHLNGAAVRLAAAAGLTAPANQAIVAALRPWAAGGRPPEVHGHSAP
jgi:2-dehydropantoate 2-reductase